MKHKLWVFFLVLMLCIGELGPVHAAPKEADRESVIEIAKAEDLLELAEKCTIDTFSIGKTVNLTANISLLGIDFEGIPYFNGTFLGNGYTISGLNLKEIGSQVGFFRYVGELGEVRNLNIMGNVLPTGSQNDVGGIAGVNYGVIEGCSFAGTVLGQESVGAIVGSNMILGKVSDCNSNALVLATNRTGGIVGVNDGVIENCMNKSKVNIEELEPVLELEGVDISDLNITHTLITRNNTGGIAGMSSGQIKDSVNYGEIGYQHTGYNVGGIVGYQSGIVANCTNQGTVLGRKDVGGIAGQAGPYIETEYLNEKTAQLEKSLKRMERTMNHLQETMNRLPEDVGVSIDGQGNVNVEQKDNETLTKTLSERIESVENDMNSLMSQMNSLNNQVNQLADEAEESPIEDVSSVKNAAKMDGVIRACINRGKVEGDLNVGGIAGTMNIESADDPEMDKDIPLDVATKTQINDVVIACINYGEIHGKKNGVGAITGLQEVGLIYDCEGYGSVSATAGSYIGGVAGMSHATIEKSYSVADLSGNHYVGGIAGLGTSITDCISMVTIQSNGECLGAVAGFCNEDGELSGNYFVKSGYDGIDNISYGKVAEPIGFEELMEREDIPAGFNQLKMTFLADGEVIEEKMVAYGFKPDESMLPKLEDRKDAYVVWPDISSYDEVTSNLFIEAEYHPWIQSVASDEVVKEGRPVAIVTGKYYEGTELHVKKAEPEIAMEEGNVICYAYDWKLDSLQEIDLTTVEIHLYKPQTKGVLELFAEKDGNYESVAYTEDGSYLVAELNYGSQFVLVERPVDNSGLYTMVAISAGVFVLVISIIIVHNKRRKKAK